MRRPIGALALAILTFLQGAYAIFVTLVFLGIVGWTFLGRTVMFPEPQWGQAILSGVMAAIYFYVSYGFWTVRIWAWIYGLLISGFNLVYLLFAVVAAADMTLESVLVPGDPEPPDLRVPVPPEHARGVHGHRDRPDRGAARRRRAGGDRRHRPHWRHPGVRGGTRGSSPVPSV